MLFFIKVRDYILYYNENKHNFFFLKIYSMLNCSYKNIYSLNCCLQIKHLQSKSLRIVIYHE